MYCIKTIKDDLIWIGGTDRRLSLFENAFPIPNGITYNSYLLMDEKTVLFDTVDHSISRQFFENLEYALQGRNLDYLIVNHMEPDHCATMGEIVRLHPDIKIICNSKTVPMIKQFYEFDIDSRAMIVTEGDTVDTGHHQLTFYMAPMVHWPEVMITYDQTDKILFSADAFGTFGAFSGNLFADELNFERDWLNEARRYYTNIVGKYGTQVQTVLKKAAALDIQYLCPLHGPVWRTNIEWYIEKYQKWSTYTPEDSTVMIAYASIYGHTENAVNILASKLADMGVRNIAMYDVSATHPSYILSECFRCSHLVFASVTYNAGIFSNMQHLLLELKEQNVQNRTVALMENGTWAITAAKKMGEIVSGMKRMNILEPSITLKSSLKNHQIAELEVLAKQITDSMK